MDLTASGMAVAIAALLVLVAGFLTGIVGEPRPGVALASAPDFYDHFADMRLLDQEGQAFRPSALAGKLSLFNFVFTGCSASCPTQTRELAALQQALPASLRRDVHFVSISVDPLADTPASLHAYGRSAGADFSSWTFAVGRPQDVDRLRPLRGGASSDRPQDHATDLWLVDGGGRLMQRYGGTGVDVARLIREITQLRDLSVASGRGPVGSGR
jgi:cytochrome oxidase Cu insertion factor (SCO1/SenC/PrrC family)